jgi:hypothetical protein
MLTFLSLSGCGGGRLLTDPPPVAVRDPESRENTIQLYERTFHVDPTGGATVRTHSILKVGAGGTEKTLSVFDGSMTRLTRYEARIVYSDGFLERYDIGDLATSTLSNSQVIANRFLRHVSIKRVPGPGDLIESISEHTLALPQLGFQFSPAEAGDRVVRATCEIDVPRGDTVLSIVVNDPAGRPPSITRGDASTVYRFEWQGFRQNDARHRFSRRNDAPRVFAITSHRPGSWREFGDWYLGAIAGKLNADPKIAAAARASVHDGMSAREKMYAVASYCQSNIRYEQVYLDGGEIIPNEAAEILKRRYGDCKDYSTLMVVLAREVGLNPDLVLCWRGSGYAFCETLPVSQFNHMIVHWQDGGEDLWFDGTNPPEAIGIASDDLINGRALILKRGDSHLATIAESPENHLSVSGRFGARGDDLIGGMTIRVRGQYAIGFHAAARQMNAHLMKAALVRWIEHSVSSAASITELDWRSDSASFVMDVVCRLPNVLWHVGDREYVRFDKVFNMLLPREEPELDTAAVFCYPGYARVGVDVTLPDFVSTSGAGEFRWEDRCELPPGPFDARSRGEFLQKYRVETEKASHAIQLRRKG